MYNLGLFSLNIINPTIAIVCIKEVMEFIKAKDRNV
jgi:hypothetical protein